MFTSLAEEILQKRGCSASKCDGAIVSLSFTNGGISCENELEDPLSRKQANEHRITYAELRIRVFDLVMFLKSKGIRKGDRVAIIADNGIEHIELYLAAALAGFIFVPIDCMLGPVGWEEIIEDVKPKIVFTVPPFSFGFDDLEVIALTQARGKFSRATEEKDVDEKISSMLTDVDIESPWVILYTSGTTSGKKKGVVRNQRGSIAGFFNHLNYMRFDEAVKFLAIYPMHGVSTFFFSLMVLYFGGECIIPNRDAASSGDLLQQIMDRYSVTFTTGGPAHCLSIIESAEKFGKTLAPNCLSQVLVSGSMVSASTKHRIEKYFQNAKIFEIYGSTELGMITILTPENLKQFSSAGSVGKEPAGVSSVRFLDSSGSVKSHASIENPGEIVAKTPMMFIEYWNRPDINHNCWTEKRLFKTGDIGCRTKDGFIALLGRADDRITNQKGQSFYPSEVERAILQHPAVHQAFVFQCSRGTYFNVCAVIRREDEQCEPLTLVEKQLKDICLKNLSPGMRPDYFWFLDSLTQLPLTGTGKVKRKLLPDVYNEKYP